MSAPTVAAVMLANGRTEMVARAVKSFLAQRYERKQLLIFNSGPLGSFDEYETVDDREWGGITVIGTDRTRSIGSLRNFANSVSELANIGEKPDVIAHFDSDDWSHPNRIAEQVALLQASGAECVGYNEMLFWMAEENPVYRLDEAWLYRAAVPNYAVGTSMAYWRETWQRNPFPDRSEGCDDLDWFNRGVKICGRPAFEAIRCEPVELPYVAGDTVRRLEPGPLTYEGPRMIASIHGGNTCAKIDAKQREWQRVPEWDAYCREAMKL